MFTFSDAILLGSVRTRDTVRDPHALEVAMKFVIFTTPIRLNCLDFSVQKALDMSLEIIKDLLNVRFVFYKIYISKMRVVINEANVVFVPSRRNTCWPPHIRMN